MCSGFREPQIKKPQKTHYFVHVLKSTQTAKARKHAPVQCFRAPSGSGATRFVKNNTVFKCFATKHRVLRCFRAPSAERHVFSNVFACVFTCSECHQVLKSTCFTGVFTCWNAHGSLQFLQCPGSFKLIRVTAHVQKHSYRYTYLYKCFWISSGILGASGPAKTLENIRKQKPFHLFSSA